MAVTKLTTASAGLLLDGIADRSGGSGSGTQGNFSCFSGIIISETEYGQLQWNLSVYAKKTTPLPPQKPPKRVIFTPIYINATRIDVKVSVIFAIFIGCFQFYRRIY